MRTWKCKFLPGEDLPVMMLENNWKAFLGWSWGTLELIHLPNLLDLFETGGSRGRNSDLRFGVAGKVFVLFLALLWLGILLGLLALFRLLWLLRFFDLLEVSSLHSIGFTEVDIDYGTGSIKANLFTWSSSWDSDIFRHIRLKFRKVSSSKKGTLEWVKNAKECTW